MLLQYSSSKLSVWRRASIFLFVFPLLLISAEFQVRGADRIPTAQPETSDTNPSPEVASEIAEIQRQLGGSIVEGRNLLSPPQSTHISPFSKPLSPFSWPHMPRHPFAMHRPSSPKSPQEHKVELLRVAAAQLDFTASQLEQADLYIQADGLRETAHSFRLEARKLRRKTTLSPKNPTSAP